MADAAANAPKSGLSAEEQERRKLVLTELDQGRASLVANDFGNLGADEKTFVKHVLAASNLVDDLYSKQTGAKGLESTKCRATIRRA